MSQNPNQDSVLKVVVEDTTDLVPSRPRGLRAVLLAAFIYDLQLLTSPTIDPGFDEMSGLARVAEALRYNAAVLEYRLGANGWLRAWIISTLRVLLLLMVPLVGITVLIAVLIPAASGVANVFQSLEAAAKSMFLAVVYVALAVLVLAALLAAIPMVIGIIKARRS